MILCDTDIFIEALKNNSRAIGSLRNIGFENIALSAITLMELRALHNSRDIVSRNSVVISKTHKISI